MFFPSHLDSYNYPTPSPHLFLIFRTLVTQVLVVLIQHHCLIHLGHFGHLASDEMTQVQMMLLSCDDLCMLLS